jgi:hypothetical protein
MAKGEELALRPRRRRPARLNSRLPKSLIEFRLACLLQISNGKTLQAPGASSDPSPEGGYEIPVAMPKFRYLSAVDE